MKVVPGFGLEQPEQQNPMNGRTLLTAAAMVGGIVASAQLWTATDINGVSHTLQDHLDDGKAVLVDVSAHWCAPCWGLHQTHALEKLYQEFGPNGTNDMMVFWIDGSWDPPSTMALLQGGNGSQGDWLEGTNFPVIGPNGEGLDLIDLYLNGATSYSFPTLYRYCPGSATPASFGISSSTNWQSLYQNMRNGCPAAFTNGANDATLLSADEVWLCAGEAPTVNLHNMGTSNLTSATITMMDGATVLSTINWTGDLARWGTAVVSFPDVDVASATDLHAVVSQPNGTADANPSGDEQDYPYRLSPTTELATMHFEIRTDGYAAETTWKLYNSNDQVIMQDPPGNYANNTTYNYWWTLNPNECYRLEVLDSYGDGLCCGFGSGYYRLRSNGVLIAEDRQFGGVTKAHFVTGAAVGVAENSLENGLSMYPNPTSGELGLQFELPSSTTLYFVVRDALGHEVMQLSEGFGPGTQRTNLDLGALANGSYYITIRSDNMTATRKVTVVH
jgi:hypothetical protein